MFGFVYTLCYVVRIIVTCFFLMLSETIHHMYKHKFALLFIYNNIYLLCGVGLELHHCLYPGMS